MGSIKIKNKSKLRAWILKNYIFHTEKVPMIYPDGSWKMIPLSDINLPKYNSLDYIYVNAGNAVRHPSVYCTDYQRSISLAFRDYEKRLNRGNKRR